MARDVFMGRDKKDLWELEVEYAKTLKEISNGFVLNEKAVKEEVMDVQEKMKLVTDWFLQFGKENGFDLTSVDGDTSSLVLVLRKSEFPTVSSQTTIRDTLLRSTSPRELTVTYLPNVGRLLIDDWSRYLRNHRLGQ